MDHRRFETLRQCQKLLVGALASRAAQQRDAVLAVQQCCQPLEVLFRGRHHRCGRQQPRDLGQRRIGCRLQRHIAGHYHDRHAALGRGLADRDFEHARHLVGAGDQLAIMAALFEQVLRVGFLKIAGAGFGRRNLGGDREHRDARPVTIIEAVDQVQIARAAAAGADRERAGQMRLRTRRKRGDLLVPDMDPLDLALPANRVGQPVQAVADNAVDPLDTGGGKGFSKLISDQFCHVSGPFSRVKAGHSESKIASSEKTSWLTLIKFSVVQADRRHAARDRESSGNGLPGEPRRAVIENDGAMSSGFPSVSPPD